MFLNEASYELEGMSLIDGIGAGYRKEDGSITLFYLRNITPRIESDARDFEVALKQFYYNYPLDGKYRIQWSIEKLEE